MKYLILAICLGMSGCNVGCYGTTDRLDLVEKQLSLISKAVIINNCLEDIETYSEKFMEAIEAGDIHSANMIYLYLSLYAGDLYSCSNFKETAAYLKSTKKLMNLRIKVKWEVSQVVYEDSKKEFDSELQKNNIIDRKSVV